MPPVSAIYIAYHKVSSVRPPVQHQTPSMHWQTHHNRPSRLSPYLPPASPLRLRLPSRLRKHIPRKRAIQRLLTTHFLAADERLDCHSDRAVDVLCGAVLCEAHLGEGLSEAHYGFEVADLGTSVSISLRGFEVEGERRRTVMGYAPVAKDSRRISAKTSATFPWSIW